MREKQRKRQDGQKALADFDRPQRVALICEVLNTLRTFDWMAADHLDEDNVRALAEHFGVPVMVLCEAFDTPVQPTTADLREWAAFDGSEAVS